MFEEGVRWVYDGLDVALVYDETGSLTNRYLHGPAIDQILADENSLGEVLWPLADNQGTIRDIAEYDSATDTTTVANHLTYTAFGAIESQTDPTVTAAYAYTGREWDADAKLYYYRHRWYAPNVGQFLSEDPITFAAGDPNLRRYVTNSPTNATDPLGLQETEDGNFIVGQQGEAWRIFEEILSFQSLEEYRRFVEIRSTLGTDPRFDPQFAPPPVFRSDPRDIPQLIPAPGTPEYQVMVWMEQRRTLDHMVRTGQISPWMRPLAGFNPVNASPFSFQSQMGILGNFVGYPGIGPRSAQVYDDAPPATTISQGPRPITRFIHDVTVVDRRTGNVLRGTVDLQSTIDRIRSGGSYPHHNDGAVFRNRPVPGRYTPELPTHPENPDYYHEYVHPTPGVNGPGPQRIVSGAGGELYYTPDHYNSFIIISE